MDIELFQAVKKWVEEPETQRGLRWEYDQRYGWSGSEEYRYLWLYSYDHKVGKIVEKIEDIPTEGELINRKREEAAKAEEE